MPEVKQKITNHLFPHRSHIIRSSRLTEDDDECFGFTWRTSGGESSSEEESEDVVESDDDASVVVVEAIVFVGMDANCLIFVIIICVIE